ncbi:hypothetical protein EVAR_56878_1 [Eumeta japonica]|uniref:Uncharacterized protein n=1 Tax=Eumeta variegata TaxID=151549 RepID=A0A4C1Z8L1_EUMVA|nr:hypothetical protein EVAR_56878_1 [Eumeta japonica]
MQLIIAFIVTPKSIRRHFRQGAPPSARAASPTRGPHSSPDNPIITTAASSVTRHRKPPVRTPPPAVDSNYCTSVTEFNLVAKDTSAHSFPWHASPYESMLR